MQIIIIDGDYSCRKILELFFIFKDVDVLSAGVGIIGYELVKLHRPDVIFLDLELPNAESLTILKMLKENVDLSHIPVVLITGCSNFILRNMIQQKYNCPYLFKPIHFDILKYTIEKFKVKQPFPQEIAII